jgi:K+ transporter
MKVFLVIKACIHGIMFYLNTHLKIRHGAFYTFSLVSHGFIFNLTWNKKLKCHGKYMNANNHLVVQKVNKSKNKSQVSC